MVMPDRMRWVYQDPNGYLQGPFTGLEMNEWYKGNFFTAEILVRKLEDSKFEPLGQLVRRIGNPFEPFLVPQLGIPHEEPPRGGSFAPGGRGALPSFGRTLHAEEQVLPVQRTRQEQMKPFIAQELQIGTALAAQSPAPTKLQTASAGLPGAGRHDSNIESVGSGVFSSFDFPFLAHYPNEIPTSAIPNYGLTPIDLPLKPQTRTNLGGLVNRPLNCASLKNAIAELSISPTISKDNTAGEGARRAELLAMLGPRSRGIGGCRSTLP